MRSTVLLSSLVLFLCLAVGGTIAFLVDVDGPLKNIFQPSQVITEVLEDLTSDPTKKQDVRIKNSGNTDAWIRATVVVTWQDSDGNVYGKAPVKDTDYEISGRAGGWLEGDDGFYYWKRPIAPGAETGILIDTCTAKGTPPKGYSLSVEIIGSGIQSEPAEVFNTEWVSSGFEVNSDGTALVER